MGFFGEHKGFGIIAKMNHTDLIDDNHYVLNELDGKV